MLIKQMSSRQIFIVCCLTILGINCGLAIYAGVSILLQLCQRYGFGVGDVLVGFQSLLPWSDNLPSNELLGVVALILQYAWFGAMVGIVQVVWRAPSGSGAVRIPDYDLRVDLMTGTCSRSDGVLWRCSEPSLQYQDYRWIIIVLDLIALGLGVLTTPRTCVEYVAPFLYSVTLWNVSEIYALDTLATATMFSALMANIALILLTITELACYLWRRIRHS